MSVVAGVFCVVRSNKTKYKEFYQKVQCQTHCHLHDIYHIICNKKVSLTCSDAKRVIYSLKVRGYFVPKYYFTEKVIDDGKMLKHFDVLTNVDIRIDLR